jgi:peptidoglycan/LPS O-acetylase OafA/YrhL
VLLPFVASWYYRHPLRGFMLALLLSMSWKFAVLELGAGGPEVITGVRLVLITQLPTYLGHFAAGMTAAWLFVKLRNAFDERHLSLAVVPVQVGAVVAILAGMRLEGTRDLARRAGVYDHWTRPTYIALVFAVLLLATALAPARLQAPFSNRFVRWLGDISYGVYLWHLLFIGFAIETLNWIPDQSAWGFARLLMFVLPGSLLAGWLSLRLVERPVIVWARTRARRLTEVPPSPADHPGTLVPLDAPPVSVPAGASNAVQPSG